MNPLERAVRESAAAFNAAVSEARVGGYHIDHRSGPDGLEVEVSETRLLHGEPIRDAPAIELPASGDEPAVLGISETEEEEHHE